jgi:hypothetical protein
MSKNLTKDSEMDQVSIKYIPTSFIARPSKIYPTLDFWFENKPSGNPASQSHGSVSQGEQLISAFSLLTNGLTRRRFDESGGPGSLPYIS